MISIVSLERKPKDMPLENQQIHFHKTLEDLTLLPE